MQADGRTVVRANRASAGEKFAMRRFLQGLKAFTEHPTTQLTTGLILLISGGSEIVSEFQSAEQSLRLGVHHGIAIYGLIQVLGSLPNIVDGIARFFIGIEKPEASR
jgi:hypothetical protein